MYHEDEVQLVEFAPGALSMATATKGGTVTIWNPRSGARITQLSHEQDVVDLAYSADGQWIVTGSLDRTARIWDPMTGRALTQLRHERQVLDLADTDVAEHRYAFGLHERVIGGRQLFEFTEAGLLVAGRTP